MLEFKPSLHLDRALVSESSSLAAERLKAPCLHLLYHELLPLPGRYSYAIERRLFEAHVDVVARARSDQDQGASAELTFDDGNASDFEYALPILNSRSLRGRFFITVGWIGNKKESMGWQQVRRICDAGHIIGGHSWSHALLTHCSCSELDRELRASRETLEDKLGIPITDMSLPGGRWNRRVLEGCRKAGYLHVFTSEPRFHTGSSDFTVGRVNVSSNRSAGWIRALLQPGSREFANLRRRYHIQRSARMVLGDWLYERLWGVVTGHTFDTRTGTAAANESTASHQ